jgi:hypothetical protein
VPDRGWLAGVEPIRFEGQVRYWSPDRAGGLAVVDIPDRHVAALGGLRQARVQGRIGEAAFTSSVMPAGGGRLALSVSKAMRTAGGVQVGETATFEILSIGRE